MLLIPKLSTLICLTTILLVGCGVAGTSEYSCTLNNIRYDQAKLILECNSPNRALYISIDCTENSFREEGSGARSCISKYPANIGGKSDNNRNFKYVIKPIVLTEKELFEKKENCAKLIPQITSRLKASDEEMGTMTSLNKVFYSLSMNSCLYDVEETKFRKGMTLDSWLLFDGLTNEQLLWRNGIQGAKNYWELRGQFDEDLKQYE